MWTLDKYIFIGSTNGTTTLFWIILVAGEFFHYKLINCIGIFFSTELDFTLAIDFTRSNLPMDDASSLHHIDGYHANQYEIVQIHFNFSLLLGLFQEQTSFRQLTQSPKSVNIIAARRCSKRTALERKFPLTQKSTIIFHW